MPEGRWLSPQLAAIELREPGEETPLDMEDLDFVPGERGVESASGLVPITSKNGAELTVRDFVTLRVDDSQMGVGGDTSWGRLVHEEYTIDATSRTYGYWLVPFDSGDQGIIELMGLP
jgi:beta-galactosidase